MQIQLLGPVLVTVDGRLVDLGPRPRSLIAVLAVEPGRVVERERLLEVGWGTENEHRSNALQQQVYRPRPPICIIRSSPAGVSDTCTARRRRWSGSPG